MPNTHVTSLELSRRLMELKVPQKSVFWWIRTWGECSDGEPDVSSAPAQYEVSQNKKHFHELWGDGCYSAYLASELGELLPAHYFTTKSSEIENHWHCNSIENFFPDDFKKGIIGDTECNARAKMLIHLLENHLISVEELGK